MQRALKDKHDWRRVGREIRILKRLKNHPAIIHVYDVVSLPSEVYVIQELAQGGSLLDYIRDRKRVSEQLAIRFFLQVVAGLQYCHDREVRFQPAEDESARMMPCAPRRAAAVQVVHRDIKLENLLMDSERNMKIIDFGLAAIFTAGKPLKVHCGSPSYAAPEIIGRRNYDGPPVDVWSLGIVTFAMVCGHLPFYSRNGAPTALPRCWNALGACSARSACHGGGMWTALALAPNQGRNRLRASVCCRLCCKALSCVQGAAI